MCIPQCKLGGTACLTLIAAHPLQLLNCGPLTQLSSFLCWFSFFSKFDEDCNLSLAFGARWMIVGWELVEMKHFHSFNKLDIFFNCFIQRKKFIFILSYVLVLERVRMLPEEINYTTWFIVGKWGQRLLLSDDDLSNFSTMETSRRSKHLFMIFSVLNQYLNHSDGSLLGHKWRSHR